MTESEHLFYCVTHHGHPQVMPVPVPPGERRSAFTPPNTPTRPMSERPFLSDEGLTALIEDAAKRLTGMAPPNVTILIAEILPLKHITPDIHGWAVLGRIYSPGKKNWWNVCWHAEEGRGRLLRYHWESPHTRSAFEHLLEDR